MVTPATAISDPALVSSFTGETRAVVEAPAADDATELSTRAISTVLLYFEKTYGRAQLDALWAECGFKLPLDYVNDLTRYVSLRFAERVIQAVVEKSSDPDFMVKACRLTVTPAAIGFAYHMIRAFGSPRLAYERTVGLMPEVNRVGSFQIESVTDTQMVLTYRAHKAEHTPYLCQGRQAQFAAFPLIWDLPEAEIHQTQCQLGGADCCRYTLEWQNPVKAWRRYAAMAGAAVTADLVATLLRLPPLGWSVMAAGFGFFAGAWWDLRLDSVRKDGLLGSQTQALTSSLGDLKRRHEELIDANRVLESRVLDRTRALEAALEVQRDLDRKKTEFFDNVSHELRTPLTIILLSLESLLMREASVVPPALRDHLLAMDRSANKLIRLINNLLDLAKMEAGKKRLAYQPMEMQTFLRSMLMPFKIVAQDKKIDLILEGDKSSTVMVDPEMMDVVFQNLVANALKFTSKGHVKARIQETESHVVVEVEDTGLGMVKEDLPLIFNRFAQADASGIRRFGGTGIGLALVKETVELHGGRIEVSSVLGQGSTFKVSLAKGEAHIREDLRERRLANMPVRNNRRGGGALHGEISRRPQPAAAVAEGDTPLTVIPPWKPRTDKKIVVVEDDPEIRRYVVAMLRDDYSVIEASDGVEGLAAVTRSRPDLIVTDVMMPNMSGFQFIEELRKGVDFLEVPVIMLTARNELESKVTGFDCGANDYITKPFTPRELIARVDAQLRIREAAVRSAQNEKLALMGLLSSGFAHEVRNPLNGLLNALTPLQSHLSLGADGETASQLLGIVRQCGDRIQQLAESLLSFVRPSSQNELLDVASSIDATLGLYRWRLPQGIQVELHFDCSDLLRADRAGLNIVWLNLLDNAVRSMGTHGTLRIASERQGNDIAVSFQDSGTGMGEDVLHHIFEPFFSTRTAGEGTGLGLSLCRRIVAQHGGRIQVASEKGKGSRFTVLLPLQPSETRLPELVAGKQAEAPVLSPL